MTREDPPRQRWQECSRRALLSLRCCVAVRVLLSLPLLSFVRAVMLSLLPLSVALTLLLLLLPLDAPDCCRSWTRPCWVPPCSPRFCVSTDDHSGGLSASSSSSTSSGGREASRGAHPDLKTALVSSSESQYRCRP